MSTHISAARGDISNIVLMPGDPKRCEFIANTYLTDVKLVNSIRNMNGYTGLYKGKRISVIPSGIGMPSIGIYAHELYKEYDVDTIIRIGTCGTLKNRLSDVVLVDNARTSSTFAFSYNKVISMQAYPTKGINNAIEETALEKNIKIINGEIYTTDAFYGKDNAREADFDGVEMETFALFFVATTLGRKASALLTVSDILGTHKQLNAEQREKGLTQMIELALESILKL